MNRKQRDQNRATAKLLHAHILDQHICEECGEKGAHWIEMSTLQDLMDGQPSGFWTCAKFYGPDGRRIAP